MRMGKKNGINRGKEDNWVTKFIKQGLRRGFYSQNYIGKVHERHNIYHCLQAITCTHLGRHLL